MSEYFTLELKLEDPLFSGRGHERHYLHYVKREVPCHSIRGTLGYEFIRNVCSQEKFCEGKFCDVNQECAFYKAFVIEKESTNFSPLRKKCLCGEQSVPVPSRTFGNNLPFPNS